MIGVDLIPTQQRLARRRRRHIARWGMALGTVAACGAIPLALGLSKHARAVELQIEEKANQAQLAAARKELISLTRQSNEVRGQIERAGALRAKRSWSALIAMIGRVAPKEVWLTAFSTDPVKPGANSSGGRILGRAKGEDANAEDHVTIDAPRRLVLQGYAANHAALYQLMGGLKNTGVFSSVTLRNAARENVLRGVQLTFELFRFELTCEW